MTEIPEHLLRRSRERRQALGLSSGEGDAAPAASTAVTPAAPTAPVAAAPPPAAVAPVEAAPAPPPAPLAPYVQAALRRRRIPFWVMPVVAALPLWALLYQYSLSEPAKVQTGPLAVGAQVYTSNCASCHLPDGAGDSAGGVGYQLNAGSVIDTFPNIADQIAFVKAGSEPVIGKKYGNPNRKGGQRVGKAGMPAWGGVLTDEQILAVVCHERVTLSGQTPVPAECTEAGATAAAAGS